MPQRSTVTECPARSFITNGTVKGAKSDVSIVRTRAKLCLPPMNSDRRGEVIPAGITERSRNARARGAYNFKVKK